MIRRALLVIDVQNEYVTGALPIAYPPLAESLPNIGRAMDAAVGAGIPVVVVQHDSPRDSPAFAVDSVGWALHPVVAGRPADRVVHKQLPGAFVGTNLEEWLRDRHIDTITLVGYMTQHCVDSTARQGMHAGLAVEVLADATGAPDYANDAGSATGEELHRVHLVALHGGFAAVAGTDAWLAAVRDEEQLPRDTPLTSAAAARTLAG